jgi:serine/threonine-protein kinase ATR
VLHQIAVKYYEKDNAIMHDCARCLGALGAADPAQVGTVTQKRLTTLASLRRPSTCLEFARELIENLLLKEYRTTNDPNNQLKFACTLQNILVYAGLAKPVAPKKQQLLFSKKEGNAFWRSFTNEAQAILKPFLKSKYCSSPLALEQSARPIYTHQKSYDAWVKYWVNSLYMSMSVECARQLLDACRDVLHIENGAVAEFMLPHLVLSGLLEKDEGTWKSIIQEMIAVLDDARDWRSDDEKQRRCVETTASIIEALFGWIKQERRRHALYALSRPSGSAQNADSDMTVTDKELSELEDRLSAIPEDLLSDAAFQCKAYARAVLHYEQYIRKQRTRRSAQDMAPLYQRLQFLYTYIDDPDGVRGISTMLPIKPLQQQIFECETTNRWGDAQTCYEVALQYDKDDPSLHNGYINTLKQLGKFGK